MVEGSTRSPVRVRRLAHRGRGLRHERTRVSAETWETLYLRPRTFVRVVAMGSSRSTSGQHGSDCGGRCSTWPSDVTLPGVSRCQHSIACLPACFEGTTRTMGGRPNWHGPSQFFEFVKEGLAAVRQATSEIRTSAACAASFVRTTVRRHATAPVPQQGVKRQAPRFPAPSSARSALIIAAVGMAVTETGLLPGRFRRDGRAESLQIKAP
jgi:hypothetical protein